MNRVANHLRNHALSLSAEGEIDVFGRSAFNRYYYACYWEIRSRLPELHHNWLRLGHKDLPKYLSGEIKTKLLENARLLLKKGALSNRDYGNLLPRTEQSIRKISDFLVRGYAIRCAADYSPEFKAIKENGSLCLNGQKLSSLETWYQEVKVQTGILKECCDSLL